MALTSTLGFHLLARFYAVFLFFRIRFKAGAVNDILKQIIAAHMRQSKEKTHSK